MGLAKDPYKEHKLPLGLIDAEGPALTGGFMRVAAQTCGSCHIGRVKDRMGNTHFLVGAPNTTWDPFLFKDMIKRSILDPRYTAANFHNAFKAKSWTWLYGSASWGIGQSAVFSTEFVFQNVLDAVRDALLGTADVPSYEFLLRELVYANKSPERLSGNIPGHVDITSPILALVPAGELKAAVGAPTIEEKRAIVGKYLPPSPVLVDFMAVFQQGSKEFGQWDGNTPDPLLRNLGAGVAGLASVNVDFNTGVHTTKFIANLPAPPYIFPVDMEKMNRGKKIFDDTCSHCHALSTFVPQNVVKTDPGRAAALTESARLALAGALKTACSDKTNPSCNLELNEVVLDRSSNRSNCPDQTYSSLRDRTRGKASSLLPWA